MKQIKRLCIVIALGLALPARAQITTNSAIWKDVISPILSASNHTGIAYGIYDVKTKSGGGGIADLFNFNQTFGTMIRLDYVNRNLCRVAGTLTLQVPVSLTTNIKLVPLLTAGIATAVSGTGSANGSATSLTGIGLGVNIWKNLDLGANYELWGDHGQVRAGVAWKF